MDHQTPPTISQALGLKTAIRIDESAAQAVDAAVFAKNLKWASEIVAGMSKDPSREIEKQLKKGYPAVQVKSAKVRVLIAGTIIKFTASVQMKDKGDDGFGPANVYASLDLSNGRYNEFDF